MKSKSIKARVTFYVVLIVNATILLVTLANVIFTQRRLVSEKKEYLMLQAQKVSEIINSWAVEEAGRLDTLADTLNVVGIDDKEVVRTLMANYYNDRSDYIFDIYFGYEESGDFIRANPNQVAPEGYDPRTRDWYTLAKYSSNYVVTDPYVDSVSPVMVGTTAIPVYIDSEFVGVLAVDVTMEQVERTIRSLIDSDGGYAFLMDSDGNLITHINKDFAPTSDGSTNISEINEKLVPLATGEKQILVTDSYNGARYFFASATIESTGWVVCIAEPIKNVKVTIFREIVLSLGITLVSLLIVITLMVHIIGVQLEPVEKMVKVIKDLSDGYFDEQLDRTAREDEIGVLQNSLANLIGILQIVIEEETYILGEVCNGNLDVEEMTEYPGQFNDLSLSVNAIPVTLNNLMKDIQSAAMNLEGTIIAIESAETVEERQQLADLLSTEVNVLMEMLSKFHIKE